LLNSWRQQKGKELLEKENNVLNRECLSAVLFLFVSISLLSHFFLFSFSISLFPLFLTPGSFFLKRINLFVLFHPHDAIITHHEEISRKDLGLLSTFLRYATATITTQTYYSCNFFSIFFL
jgi:hypothetical protein